MVTASAPDEPAGPRRSALVQERSRQTRRKLVRTALALWTERGFERGIKETTVEEIVRAAGVTKGTFYFHFAHKEDILLELGWNAADRIYEATGKALADELPIDESLSRVLTALARQVEQAPKEAVAHSVAEFYRSLPGRRGTQGHMGFGRSFSVLFRHARDTRQLPPSIDPAKLGATMEALTMDAILHWSMARSVSLRAMLGERAELVLAGARALGRNRRARKPAK